MKHDDEARWAGHRRRKPVHGDRAHVATDQDAVLIHGVQITTANIYDAAELEAMLPNAPGPTDGDSADWGQQDRADHSRSRWHCARVHSSTWGGPDALEGLQEYSADVRRIRFWIAKVLRTWRRSYGLRRMRWLGLAKAGLQVRLAAMA